LGLRIKSLSWGQTNFQLKVYFITVICL
jgi:hypothetical protein